MTAPAMVTAGVERLRSLHLPPDVDRAALLAPWTEVLNVPPYPLAVTSPEYRRAITRTSPIRFALLYLSHHLRSPETGGLFSLAAHHFTLHGIGAAWRKPGRHRDIVVAPRYGAKSTWMVILTLWALCHRHRRFALWISDSAPQAQLHLATLRQELESNALLRHDFPHMLPPSRGQRGARDNQQTYTSRDGTAAVAVRGADTKSLGLKLGSSRPDLIWLDDVEPEESNYSAAARAKRLGTILHAILPMNEQAAVVMTGTVTMYGSITHAAVQAVTGEVEEPEPWIADEGFAVHYTPALTIADDGTPRSFWPERYSAGYLMSIRHTRNYALNFACRPPLPGGHQWTEKTFRHGQHRVGALVMQIDPAPTATPKSDYSAIIVGGSILEPELAGHVSLEYAEQVRLTPARLRDRVDFLLMRNPRIRKVRVAGTGAGGTWAHIFRDLPGGVELDVHSDARSNSGRPGAPEKDLKFARLLEAYERGRVWHAEHFPELEDQLKRWPEVEHDDLGDCASELVRYLVPE